MTPKASTAASSRDAGKSEVAGEAVAVTRQAAVAGSNVASDSNSHSRPQQEQEAAQHTAKCRRQAKQARGSTDTVTRVTESVYGGGHSRQVTRGHTARGETLFNHRLPPICSGM